jgi:NAD(P)-dependent dehydrogenase (short-subunit alcohol dehydrogenase family)
MSKSYLIIGASSGIGLELTRQLTNEGNHVYAVARKERELSSLSNVTYIELDVLSAETFELDISVLDGFAYCPGTINLKPFHRLTKEDFLHDFEVNVYGAINMLQKALPSLKKGINSSIVLFSTVAVNQGMGFHSSIAASKGAVEGLTKSLAAELSPSIRVNCVAPSVTNTPLAERILSSPEKEEASAKRHPLQRVGTSKDIANAAHFLLSEKSGWITGQIVGVDGGLSTLRML